MADGIRLSDLVAAMARKGNPLATETGLFIALQASEALSDNRAAISTAGVRVTVDGMVEVTATASATASESDCVRAIASMVETVVAPLPPGARAMIERARGGQIKTLEGMRAEIEALLVPLNRSAARRVLGRLTREHARNAESAPTSNAAKGNATDTSPDARVSGGSALDTVDESSEGSSDAMPQIPPPPRLGSLASFSVGGSATDTEPDTRSAESRERAGEPRESATDTTPDSESLEADALRSGADETGNSVIAPPLGPSGGTWLGRFMLMIAMLILGGAVFLLYRLTVSDEAVDGETPAAHETPSPR